MELEHLIWSKRREHGCALTSVFSTAILRKQTLQQSVHLTIVTSHVGSGVGQAQVSTSQASESGVLSDIRSIHNTLNNMVLEDGSKSSIVILAEISSLQSFICGSKESDL